MTTLAQLRTEMNRLLKATSNGLLDTDIDQAINDAVSFHQDRAFDFNEGFAQIATVDGQPAYALPTDLARINNAQLFWGGQNFTVLIKRNWEWYLRVNQDASQLRAVPSTHYAVNRQQIFLYPTPSVQPTRIELYYTKKYDPLINDDDTNDFLMNARLLVRSQAMHYVYLHRLQQKDFAQAQLATVGEELEKLYRRANGVLGAEVLEPYRF